ncbi:MAG: STAS domain-containing protein [Gammaproteobacteria bacterium]|nr:STAS domain-containing protein [Gammaproteobacteria bacterium]
MSLRKHTSGDNKTVTISIDGMFDLSLQGDFRKAYEESGKGKRYVIDLRGTEYMDSSAFGMLLVFKDYVGGDKAEISIVNTSDDLRKSFSMLQFDRMFDVS